MLSLRRATMPAVLLISAAMTFAACASSANATPTPATTPVPAAETPAAETPAAETPAAETPAAGAPTPEVPSLELGGLAGNLSNTESYRIAISINGTASYQATVVTKPEKAEQITLGDGSDTTRIIKIGGEAWLATGTDAFQSVPVAMVTGLTGAFDPLLMLGAFANGNIGAIARDLGSEQKNGVDAHHFRLDSTSSLAGAFASLPAGAAIDFWVAGEGYLVGYALTGTGTDGLSIDITNVNDPANKVERPR